MATSTPSLTRFRVEYRRDMTRRKYRVTVVARTPDEARVKASIRDPQYLSSVSVHNLGDIEGGTFQQPACYICREPITDDLYTRVDFGPTTGIQLVCDVDMERAS